MGNFIITFMLFPSLTVSDKNFEFDFVWSSLIFIAMYNIGDTAGKYLG